MAIAAPTPKVRVISFPDRMYGACLPAILLAACVHGAPAVPATSRPGSEARWLSLELAGEPVGRTHEVVDALTDGGFATHVTPELRIGRLGSVVEMATGGRRGAGAPLPRSSTLRLPWFRHRDR